MSIVSVHGPYTWGSKGVLETGPVVVNADPNNGLKWDFRLDASTTRPDQDFSWAFPTDGTPTPQAVADPSVVTYATPGAKTATVTVTNFSRTVSNKALTNEVATITTTAAHGFKVGQGIVVAGVDATFNGTYVIASIPTGTTFTYAKPNTANVSSAASGGTASSDPAGYPAAGAYPITITAQAGVGPRMVEQSAGGEEFDPGPHTVHEVLDYVNEHPDLAGDIYYAEQAGKNRTTLLTQLQAMLPFDPGEYTVGDVVTYATSNPDQLDDIIAKEEAGKNRTTLLTQLHALRG